MQQDIPRCWYDKETDCLWYTGPKGDFKVESFLMLPGDERQAILEKTEVDHDDIKGIEDIWIYNADEMHEEMSAAEAAFCKGLRERKSLQS